MKNTLVLSLLLLPLLFLFSPLLFTFSGIAGNYGDIYLHYYPLKYLVSEQIISGRVPLWNPYIFAGQPLLANPQSSIFYPLGLLFYLLPLPAAFNYFIVLHFFLAAVFMYILLRSEALPRTASLAGAFSFSLSAFLLYKVPSGHPVALSGYVWVPLVLMFLNRMAGTAPPDGRPYLLQAGNYSHRAVSAAFSLAVTFQFLSGHTFPLYITLVVIALHLLYHRLAYWKELLAGVLLFIFLAALQLLPTIELSGQAETANWPQLVRTYSLPPLNLVNLLLPGFFGNIRSGTYVFRENPSFFFELHPLYFGILPLLLAVGGLVAAVRERRFFALLLIVAGLVLAFGFHTPVYRWFYDFVPLTDFLRVPARFFFIALIGMILLAAKGWQAHVAPRPGWVKLLLLAVILFDLLLRGSPFIYSEDIRDYRKKSEVSSSLDPLYRVVTEPGVLPSNKAMLYHHYNLNGYEAVFLKDFVRYLGLQEKYVFTTTGLARADIDSPLSRGFAHRYLLTPRPDKETEPVAAFSGGLRLYQYPAYLPRLFVAATTRSAADMDVYEQIDYLARTPSSPARELLIAPGPNPAPAASGRGKLVSFLPEAHRVSAELVLDAPATVVLGDLYYPGWKAAARKEKIGVRRGNKVFRAMVLPGGNLTGRDRLYVYFRPASWMLGLYLTLAALLSLVLLMVMRKLVN